MDRAPVSGSDIDFLTLQGPVLKEEELRDRALIDFPLKLIMNLWTRAINLNMWR